MILACKTKILHLTNKIFYHEKITPTVALNLMFISGTNIFIPEINMAATTEENSFTEYYF